VGEQKSWTVLELFRRIDKLIRKGTFVSEVGKNFALTDIYAFVR
jgi:hypothetical protein